MKWPDGLSNMQIGKRLLMALSLMALAACGGGGEDAPASPQPQPPQSQPPAPRTDSVFATRTATMRFLTQATFGPRPTEAEPLIGSNGSDWYRTQIDLPANLHQPNLARYRSFIPNFERFNSFFFSRTPSFSFYTNVLTGEDQLRQRMAFALSQIFVVSDSSDLLQVFPEGMGYFQDILITNAFGNYRDILEDVTYSPAMGYFLTYAGNQREDPETGRMPDENYAREILQLFSIGLVDLNNDGTSITGGDGNPQASYSNVDISGLARVFTGLDLDFRAGADAEAWTRPMRMNDEEHESGTKTFLGTTIPANTNGTDSIDIALDTIFNHPNVPAFFGRQLIQRFITSNPAPDYVARVADAFISGAYVLPDGSEIGSGTRGDLSATLAAVLFDDEARSDATISDSRFGKIREPIIRFTNWVRAFDVGTIEPALTFSLYDTSRSDSLNQNPYRAPSVFNFYRPGFIAPGTRTGGEGLTMPELQITNTSSIAGYINFISFFALDYQQFATAEPLQNFFDEQGVTLDTSDIQNVFRPDYSTLEDIADDPEALAQAVIDRLSYDTFSTETTGQIIETIANFDSGNDGFINDFDRTTRVQLAVILVMTSPDYLLQR